MTASRPETVMTAEFTRKTLQAWLFPYFLFCCWYRARGASSLLFLLMYNGPHSMLQARILHKKDAEKIRWMVSEVFWKEWLNMLILFCAVRLSNIHSSGMIPFKWNKTWFHIQSDSFHIQFITGCFRVMWKQAARFACLIEEESFKLQAGIYLINFHQTDKAV